MQTHSSKVNIDWLRRLRKGDEIAFGLIYQALAPILYQRLLRLLKSTDTVEEILQDVFLKIWEKREQIDPDKGFNAYVWRIADHLVIDCFRKISRDRKMQQELWASSVSFYFQIEEALIAKEERQLITDAINRLPPKRKQILMLCKLENKSYQEVAALMGISVSTVSNQLVKAIKEIRSYVVQSTCNDGAGIIYFLLFFSHF